VKYKIGEVSRILNIPVDTLRYYEKKQFVNPEKDKYNNYRYYHNWDLYYLLEYKRYRSLEFSISEINAIVNNDAMDDFIERMEEKKQKFRAQKQYYAWMEQRLRETGETLRRARDKLWQCAIVNDVGFYYILQAFEQPGCNNLFAEWEEFCALADHIIYIKMEDALRKDEKEKYLCGFALGGDWGKKLPVHLNPKARHFYAEHMLRTVIRAGGEGTFSYGLLDKAFQYIKENGYTPAGDILGTLLARVHEPDGYARYIEIWIPLGKVP
jgi:DNA-binding transcriptional MerR regulator